MHKLGGASGVLTGDTRQEVIDKATKWYKGAFKCGLWPRVYVYGKGDIEIEVECKGQKATAYIQVIDTTQKPADAETVYPFPFFSKFVDEAKLKKRYHTFVSAHC